VPVELTLDPASRLPEPVEAAAYYVVAEALTNVAKYASATVVHVTVERAEGEVVVTVSDDTVGGADAAKGSGLRGLSDRGGSDRRQIEIRSPRRGHNDSRSHPPRAGLTPPTGSGTHTDQQGTLAPRGRRGREPS
jgi:nitrate/nitrite-specific signal transduction histidine kinase